MNKILFLDIDGVLNSSDWYSSDDAQELRHIKSDNEDRKNYKFHFDPRKVDLLSQIIDSTDCQIVISSSWRKNRTVEKLQEIFKIVGFSYPEKIVGSTDVFYSWLKEGVHCSSVRGLEIRVWLEKNREFVNPLYAKTYRYCILDDNSDMLLDQQNNFVKCTNQEGLTLELANRVIQILNK